MAEYFSHDYDAREDEKIQNLIYQYGMLGYGIYWAIVEMLYKNNGYMQTQYERIAFALHTESEVIKSVINNFDLFEINENAFTSASVLHRLKLRKGKSYSASKAAKARWNKAKAKDANAMQTQCDSNAKKKSKGKESKVEESKEIFDEFRILYPGTKRGLDTEYENFKKKTKDWQDILPELKESLNKQIDTRDRTKKLYPDKFLPEWKHLQTYINQRSWEEEITIPKSGYTTPPNLIK